LLLCLQAGLLLFAIIGILRIDKIPAALFVVENLRLRGADEVFPEIRFDDT
jgi:hypothetical protein